MSHSLPLVVSIHRFALDDGPGIRSTVFLKGCPLSCVWCHNPESIRRGLEIGYSPRICISCGCCAAVCPEAAIELGRSVMIARASCRSCGACADNCPSTALKRLGRHYPVDQLIALLLKDRHFFSSSGGGVTFSGGEPTLHVDYLGALLQALREHEVPTAVQSCGYFDPDLFEALLLPWIDLIYFDLKVIDPVEHELFTGRSNKMILSNFRRLCSLAPAKVIPRIPLIPGITATRENLGGLAALISECGCSECELLSYNPGVIAKRHALDLDSPDALPESMMSVEQEQHWRSLFAERSTHR